VISEESTTPDLVELTRQPMESVGRRELDAAMSFFAPDAVWDTSPLGLGVYEGTAAIRAFIGDWIGTYEELDFEFEEVLDFGRGVTLAVIHLSGRPVGSSGHVQLRYASVLEWTDGLIARVMHSTDIDEARAGAERLAQERG